MQQQRSLRYTLAVLAVVLVAWGVTQWLNSKPPRGSQQGNGGTASPTPRTTAAASAPVTGSGKERPVAQVFQGCPAVGDGGDGQLNILKNRIDDAGAYQSITADTIVNWGWPKAIERTDRSRWSPADSKTVEQHEGLPVVVQGYLAGAKEEGPETPNCHAADQHDYHIWLSTQQGPDRTRSVVVELTPRIRANHPRWNISALNRVVRQNVPVRVSGWIMLDPEHPDQVGKTRGTIWEVHPVMHLEVQSGGRWIDLADWNG